MTDLSDLIQRVASRASATKERVVVGLSGGVDSSVAAWLLKEQGYDVVGLFMKNWEDDDTDEYCTTREDLIDAVSVADRIGIDVEAVNFAAEYKERVFSNFLAEYQAGRTPNPDVLCNAEIKFKAFLDHAMSLGAHRIATGHYARVREVEGSFQLLRGLDASKDQSYFLHRLVQSQISRAMFPVGELKKTEVREIARHIGLANHAKRDSTGICFIGERPFREFLMRYLAPKPGPMQTPEGKVVGQHHGLMYYTLGQRQGLGIGGAGEAWYVIAKDMANNRLMVAQGHDHPALYHTHLTAGQITWISGQSPDPSRTYGAKTRYRQTDAVSRLSLKGTENFSLEFDVPQWAVTPGQSAVLYDGEVCLGGGIID